VSDQSSAPEPGERQQVSVRRAPKLGAFIVVGAALGFLVTLIATTVVPRDPSSQVGLVALVAYFSLYGITAGVVIGALIGIGLDRRSRTRARTVDAVHEVVDPATIEAEIDDERP
jgi:F0F1-type ATP synthase assembly protein I